MQALESQLFDAWAPEAGGGIPWRKGSNFYNAPANGPAGIMLARTGKLWRAQATADWIDDTLRDVHTDLIVDGIHPGGEIERNVYSYCQGVVLGLETELAVRLGSPRHRNRTHRLVDAIDEHLAPQGVIDGGGGGDGGLFNGILARYLALTAVMLPWESPADIRAREIAAQLVLTSAEAAWENRLQIEGQPLFGHDWTRQAQLPGFGAGNRHVHRRHRPVVGRPGTRPVRPARRLDADGGRAHGVGRGVSATKVRITRNLTVSPRFRRC